MLGASDARPAIQVAAAVLRDERGRVLITERPAGKPMSGYWEFPGGKLEAGEAVWPALQRELWEELGVRASRGYPLLQITHDYPERRVHLHVWRVSHVEGKPAAREKQGLAWVSPQHLREWKLLPADQPIVHAIQYPPLMLVTPDPGDDGPAFLRLLEQSLQSGVDWVRFRAPYLDPAAYARLAGDVIRLCHHYGCRVSIQAGMDLSGAVVADGVHYSDAQLRRLDRRPSVGATCLGASCHSREGIQQAIRCGLDYVVLGPVLKTPTHPGMEPLGWHRFAEMAATSTVPVYAIGGLQPGHLEEARRHGGHGIAAIRSLWGGIQSFGGP